MLFQNLCGVFHQTSDAVSHLPSVDDQHEEIAVFRLTDGTSRLQSPSVGSLHHDLAVDDEGGTELECPAVFLCFRYAPLNMEAVVSLHPEEQIVVVGSAVIHAVHDEAAHDGAAVGKPAFIQEAASVDGKHLILAEGLDEVALIAEILGFLHDHLTGILDRRQGPHIIRSLHLYDENVLRNIQCPDDLSVTGMKRSILTVQIVDHEIIVSHCPSIGMLIQPLLKEIFIEFPVPVVKGVLIQRSCLRALFFPVVPAGLDLFLVLIGLFRRIHHIIDNGLRNKGSRQPLMIQGGHGCFDVQCPPFDEERNIRKNEQTVSDSQQRGQDHRGDERVADPPADFLPQAFGLLLLFHTGPVFLVPEKFLLFRRMLRRLIVPVFLPFSPEHPQKVAKFMSCLPGEGLERVRCIHRRIPLRFTETPQKRTGLQRSAVFGASPPLTKDPHYIRYSQRSSRILREHRFRSVLPFLRFGQLLREDIFQQRRQVILHALLGRVAIQLSLPLSKDFLKTHHTVLFRFRGFLRCLPGRGKRDTGAVLLRSLR